MGARLLAIDTATIACSVALFEDGALIAADYAEIGRGHAEKLIPAIAQLPHRGRADKILVNCGPGSFTGVRIGISAAKALALAMHAGHGEYFLQNFFATGEPMAPFSTLTPDQAASQVKADIIAGSAAAELAAATDTDIHFSILPNAAHISLVCSEMKILPAKPNYGRKPDAQPAKTV